jgi:hypothetical protein
MSSSEEESLRAELIEDLSPIADLRKSGSARFKRSGKLAAAERIQSQLDYLCEKINDLEGLRPVLRVDRRAIKADRRLQSRAQGVFSWGAGEWIVRLDFTDISRSRDERKNLWQSQYRWAPPRTTLYGYIAAGLISGELARLRRCGYCTRFFIAPEPRMTFCPHTNHGRLYYDRPRQRTRTRLTPNAASDKEGETAR